jgi:paraquat-inducible protein B
MKKQINPTMIGVFVVGAIALAVAAVIVFGSGRFFAQKYKFVAFFEGSVFGLNQGAPVICKGVRVGTVTGIELLSDPEEVTMQIAVFFETEPKKIHVLGRRRSSDSETRMKKMIEHGLRARLEMQSFLTRQLMLVLGFYPDTPVSLVGIQTGYPEVPTIRSPMQEFMDTVESLPLEEIVNSIRDALKGIEEVVHSPEIAESLDALKGTMVAAEELVKKLEQQIDPLMANLDGTLVAAQKLLRNVDAKVDPLASVMEETLEAARLAILEAEQTIESLQGTTGEDSALVHALTGALTELSAASRSIRILAETLESQPESLLRGKGSSGGK